MALASSPIIENRENAAAAMQHQSGLISCGSAKQWRRSSAIGGWRLSEEAMAALSASEKRHQSEATATVFWQNDERNHDVSA